MGAGTRWCRAVARIFNSPFATLKRPNLFSFRPLRFGLSVAVVLVSTLFLGSIAESVNATTVALTLLLCVLFSATFFGRNPALLASFVAMLCFNYFFLPPVRTWTIADPQNLVAWAAFTITAIIAGELSAYARRRAIEAERLYAELRQAFEKAANAEALERSEHLKSALLDAVTHDLRTPLTSIKASVTTLLDSEGGHRTIELGEDERVEFLQVIDEETDRLNGFIEGMVELARIEAGTPDSDALNTDVEEIIHTALLRCKNLVGNHLIDLKTGGNLPSVKGDPRALAEAVYILLDNAAKYSPPGSSITIGASADDGFVKITVSDEGPGIPADKRDEVFEKFVRLDKQPSAGLGLGLAIARRIIQAHNGTIKIKNGLVGKGTTVVITLPAAELHGRKA